MFDAPLCVKQQGFDRFAGREPHELLARHRVQPAEAIWPANGHHAVMSKTDKRVALSKRALLSQWRTKVRGRTIGGHSTAQSEKNVIAHAVARYCWPLKSL